MTKTNKKQKNLSNPVELQEHLSHRIGNVGEVRIYPVFIRGDTLTVQGKNVVVVEVIEESRWHVKNISTPYDSFIITGDDLSDGQGGSQNIAGE